MNDLKQAQIYRKAANLISQRGWRSGPQGWKWQRGEEVCLEGALMAVHHVHFDDLQFLVWRWRAYRQSVRLLRERINLPDRMQLSTWNDSQYEAKPVIDLLQNAAHDLELRHQIHRSAHEQNRGKRSRLPQKTTVEVTSEEKTPSLA